jgi:hypothetical protein
LQEIGEDEAFVFEVPVFACGQFMKIRSLTAVASIVEGYVRESGPGNFSMPMPT